MTTLLLAHGDNPLVTRGDNPWLARSDNPKPAHGGNSLLVHGDGPLLTHSNNPLFLQASFQSIQESPGMSEQSWHVCWMVPGLMSSRSTTAPP